MEPVLSGFLAHVKPAAVRQKVAELDPECFAAQHEAILLVSVYFLL